MPPQGLKRIWFDLNVISRRNISYTEITARDGNKLFSPWFAEKDRFGGIVRINESTPYCGEPRPRLFLMSAYNTFIPEPVAVYPTWFGYFDNHYVQNREWRNHGMQQVFKRAEFERILTPELEQQIRNLKFRKLDPII